MVCKASKFSDTGFVKGNGLGKMVDLPSILAVGEVSHWRESNSDLPLDANVQFIKYDKISTRTLAAIAPDIVISLLFSEHFDCVDLAQKLYSLGFNGQFRVLMPDIPKPQIISAELRALCPGLEFSLVKSGYNNSRWTH